MYLGVGGGGGGWFENILSFLKMATPEPHS